MFEHRTAPLASRAIFLRRLVRSAVVAFCLILGSLGLGVAGYRLLAGFSWTDALLNASMILGGMGPVDTLPTGASKIFASFYALFSGIAFLTIVAVLVAPVFHRFLHRFHVELLDEDDAAGAGR